MLFISAEGRGLAQRLRGWCIRNFPGEDYANVLKRAPVYCVEHPVNLSDPGSALALVESVNALGIAPGLIVIDTMSRNSDGKIVEDVITRHLPARQLEVLSIAEESEREMLRLFARHSGRQA